MDTDDRYHKPRLIFIHGFGASGMCHYKMCSVLRHYFRITTIDMLGLGASGRPNFTHIKSGKDSLEFYVGALEAWFIREGLIPAPIPDAYGTDSEDEAPYYESVYLMGHSLGGFMSV